LARIIFIEKEAMELEKMERPTTEVQEQQTEKSRMQKLAGAFFETFQRVFHPEKFQSDRQEQQLRDELVSRGFLRTEVALGMNASELQSAFGDVYRKKFTVLSEATSINTEWDKKKEMQEFFEINSDLHFAIFPGDIKFNYSGNVEEYQRQWTKVRQQVDEAIPDDKFFSWQQLEAIKKEQARNKEMRDLWLEYQEEMEKEWGERQKEFKQRVEEQRQSIRRRRENAFKKSWAMIQEKETQELEKMDSHCKKDSLTEKEVGFLKGWLHFHKEFGLQEMSDEEYNSFFSEGRFYAHFSYLFGNDKYKEQGPKFIEALKDGYLIPRVIGKQRGEVISGLHYTEATVCFDNENIIRNGDNNTNTDHSIYAECPKKNNFPVTLVSPAGLMENHTFYKGMMGNGEMGKGEGFHFGSIIPDPFKRAHEIDMSLFTMLVPDSRQVSVDLLRGVVDNLESFVKDPHDLEELRKMAASMNEYEKYQQDIQKRDRIMKWPEEILLENIKPEELERLRNIQKPNINISTRDFMTTLFYCLQKEGVHVPRLYFYTPEYDQDLDNQWKKETIKAGLKDFLAEKAPNTLTHGFEKADDVDLLGPRGYMRIPELMWADRKKMEEVANKVRRILKRQQTERAAEEATDLKQDFQGHNDLLAIKGIRDKLQGL
jgi:hypothetical protein